VKGRIEGEKKDHIYISRVDVDKPVLIDSAKVSRRGSFSFRVKASMPDFYQVGYSSTDYITLLAAPGEKIELAFRGNNLYKNYDVKGSDGTSKIKMLDDELSVTSLKLDSLTRLYNESSSLPGFDKRGPELDEQFRSVLKDQRRKNIAFVITNTNSLAAIKALYQKINSDTYVLYDPKDLQYLKIVTDSLTKYYPESKHVQALARDFSKELNQLYASQVQSMAQKLPETKLDPDLKTIDGRRVKLSSLKGKYVLLTFWSVNSKECLQENLELKNYYQRYKNQGFEIYQINLDQDEEVWRNAVKFDELPWISTREDDPANPLNARIFNVRSLPANFLYDKDGRIIATNLHGRALQIKFNQLFK
jgi:thioredoxin-related protein